MTAEGPSFVAAHGVAKTYATRSGPIQAVAQATFTARSGEFVSLLGPSGCGKSTLLMMMAGLEPPSAGDLTLAGLPVTGPRRDTGIIFQDATLLPWKSALDNVLFPIRILKLRRDDYLGRAHELLLRVGLGGFEHKRRTNCRAACASASRSAVRWSTTRNSSDGRAVQRARCDHARPDERRARRSARALP